MLELLLVDDEPVIRMTFRNLLPWDETPWHIAGMVANGEEALAFLDSQHVDIIITDMKMPRMSGLELIHRLKERAYPGAILVLSNYSDYSLVRQAMSLGARDYILKADLDEPVMYEALSRLSVNLTKRGELTESSKTASAESTRRTILRNVLLGYTLPAEISEMTSLLPYSPYMLLDVHITENSHRPIARKSVRNVILANFDERADVICLGDNEYICLIPSDAQDDKNVLCNHCRQLVRQLKLYLNCKAKILLSAAFADVEEMCKQHDLCDKTVRLQFYHPLEDCMFVDNVELQTCSKDILPEDIAEVLAKSSDADRQKWLANLLQRSAEQQVDPSFLKKHVADVLQSLLQRNANTSEEIEFACEVDMLACKSSEQLYRTFVDILSTTRSGTAKSGQGTNVTINRIKDYLQTHFSERITLDSLASMVNLERSYLSRLFKKETGMNIFQFLADVRLEEARKLLVQEGIPVRKAAEKVGIEDSFYFSRMFKKRYGVTPSDYVQRQKSHD